MNPSESPIMKNIILACFYLLFLGSMAFSQPGKKAIPEGWKLGTSNSILEDFTPDVLKQIKKSGIDYLELAWKQPQIAATPQERLKYAHKLSRDVKKAGLKLWSTHIPYGKNFDISETKPVKRKLIIAVVKEYIDLAEEMGVQQMVIHPSAEPITDEERPARILASRASLQELAVYCKSKKASLALECLPRTCLGNTSTEMLQILEGIDNVGICFDSNHMLKEKPEEFVQAVGNRIRTVHIADYDAVNERHWMPGKGIINFNKVISALIESGYNGAFMYEVVKRKDDTFTFKDLKANYENLKKSWIEQ